MKEMFPRTYFITTLLMVFTLASCGDSVEDNPPADSPVLLEQTDATTANQGSVVANNISQANTSGNGYGNPNTNTEDVSSSKDTEEDTNVLAENINQEEINQEEIASLVGDEYQSLCAGCHGLNGESDIFAQLQGRAFTYENLSSAIQTMFDGGFVLRSCRQELTSNCVNLLADYIFSENERFKVTELSPQPKPLDASFVFAASCAGCHGDEGKGNNGKPGFNGNVYASKGLFTVKVFRMFGRTAGKPCGDEYSDTVCAQTLASYLLDAPEFAVSLVGEPVIVVDVDDNIETETASEDNDEPQNENDNTNDIVANDGAVVEDESDEINDDVIVEDENDEINDDVVVDGENEINNDIVGDENDEAAGEDVIVDNDIGSEGEPADLSPEDSAALADIYTEKCASCHGANGENDLFAKINGNRYTEEALTLAIDAMFDRGLASGSCASPFTDNCSNALANYIFENAEQFNVTKIEAAEPLPVIADVFEAKCATCHGENGEGRNGNPHLNDKVFESLDALTTKVLAMLDRSGGRDCQNGESGNDCATSLAKFLTEDNRFNSTFANNPAVDDTVEAYIETQKFVNNRDAQTSFDLPVARSEITSNRDGLSENIVINVELAGTRVNDIIELVLTSPDGDQRFYLFNEQLAVDEDLSLSFFVNAGAVSSLGDWELRLEDQDGGTFIDRWELVFPAGDTNAGEQAWNQNFCVDCHRLDLDRDNKGIAVAAIDRDANDDFFKIDPLELKNTNLEALSDYIFETMPLGLHTSVCKEKCAADTAAFIRSWIEVNVDEVIELNP